jgi:sugar phosphate isomerase/epimerase
MMQLGIFAKTFEGSTPSVVMAAAARAGFATVQYNMACSGLAPMPDHIGPEQATAVAAAAKDHGFSVAAVSGTYNMIHPDKAVREAGHARLAVLASRCALMGTRMITLCTGSRDAQDQWRWHRDNDTADAWRDLLQSMEVAIGIADRYGIDLGIEPELANAVSSAGKAAQLIRELRSPCLKIVLDPANLFERTSLEEQRRILSDATDLLGGHIAMAHAKDRAADGTFVAAGTGVVDFPHFISCLRRTGFNGPLVTHGLTAAEAPSVARFLQRVTDPEGSRAS